MPRMYQKDCDADGGSSFPRSFPPKAIAGWFALPDQLSWRSLWSSFPAGGVPPPADSAHTAPFGGPNTAAHQRLPERAKVLLWLEDQQARRSSCCVGILHDTALMLFLQLLLNSSPDETGRRSEALVERLDWLR